MAATTRCVPLLVAVLSCSEPHPELVSVRPAYRDIERALSTNGRIEATGRVAVHSTAAGRVERVLVRPGDQVSQGQELVRLADAGQVASREQAAARVQGAKSRLSRLEAGPDPVRRAVLQSERSKQTAARKKVAREIDALGRLVASGAAPRSELEAKQRLLDDLELDVSALDAQIEATPPEGQRGELEADLRDAKAALRAAHQEADRLSIRAPGDGVVYSLTASRGDFLSSGGLVARIGILATVRALVFVDEPDLGRVEMEDVALVTADAYPGEEWRCVVDRLATEVVEIGPRRVGQISCKADNPDGRLLPNLSVGVRIVTDRAGQVLSVPRSAVRRSESGAFVWILDDGRVARRLVDTGVEGPIFIEIREGVGPSDSVLVPGDEPLSDGQRLEIIGHGETDG